LIYDNLQIQIRILLPIKKSVELS